jgi:hypothetical protein
MWKWWQERQTSRIINETEESIRENKRYLAQLNAPGPVSTHKIDDFIHYTDRFIQDFDEKNPDIANQISKKRSGFWWRLANAAAAYWMEKYGDYNPAAALRRLQKAEFPDVPANASGGLTPEQTYERILENPDKPGIVERMTDFLVKRPKIVTAATALSLFGLGAGISANVVDADDDPDDYIDFEDFILAAENKGKVSKEEKEEGRSPIHFWKPKDHIVVYFYAEVKNTRPEKWGDLGPIYIDVVDARFPNTVSYETFPKDGKWDETREFITAKLNCYLGNESHYEKGSLIPHIECVHYFIDFEKFKEIDLRNLPHPNDPVVKEFLKKFRTDPKSPSDSDIDNPWIPIAIAAGMGTPAGVYYLWNRRKKKKDSAS